MKLDKIKQEMIETGQSIRWFLVLIVYVFGIFIYTLSASVVIGTIYEPFLVFYLIILTSIMVYFVMCRYFYKRSVMK